MPNALETPLVTVEVNDVPLSLCNDLGRSNLGMISRSSFLTTSSWSSCSLQASWGLFNWQVGQEETTCLIIVWRPAPLKDLSSNL